MEEDIFNAIREGNEGLTKTLIDADPGLLESWDSYDGDTPLIVAARREQLGVMRLLVQRGANIDDTGAHGSSALHFAALEGREGVVAYLLSNGAQAAIRDAWQMTPLMFACREGHLGVINTLLQHTEGQGLDEHDERGKTALRFAAETGHEAVVKVLLRKGAQASIRDNIRKGPLMYACEGGHLGVVQMLLQHTAGQGLEEASNRGETALHSACKLGYVEVVRCLLLAGADRTTRNHQGRTPRDLAEPEVEPSPYWPEGSERATTGRARCVALFQWWEGELERCYALSKAACLHKAFTTQRDKPTSRVPTYLEARVAAGHAVPRVEVVMPQSQGEVQEKEVHAVLGYVVQSLNEELLTELLEGFHGPRVEA